MISALALLVLAQSRGYPVEVSRQDYALDGTLLTTGQIPGASVVLRFGRNPDVDTGTLPEDVWNGGGVYTGFPLLPDGGLPAETLEIFSSSAADTFDGGTGARTLRLSGLNTGGAVITETVNLNGAAGVLTTQPFSRMAMADVLTAGSGEVNAGSITVRHSTTTANVFAVLPVGLNQSMVCAYTVPAGHTGYLRGVNVQLQAGASGGVHVALWTRRPGEAGRFRRTYDMTDAYSIHDPIWSGVRVLELSDIKLRVISTLTSNVAVNCSLEVVLLRN